MGVREAAFRTPVKNVDKLQGCQHGWYLNGLSGSAKTGDVLGIARRAAVMGFRARTPACRLIQVRGVRSAGTAHPENLSKSGT